MRTKKQLLQIVRLGPITSREELLQVCQETSRLTIERDLEVTARDEAVLTITEKYDPVIESLNAEIERRVERLRTWSVANRASEFRGKQGITVSGCELEFRKGTGKVVSEKTDKAAVDAILALPDELEQQIDELTRIKVDLDKDAVKRIAKTPEGIAFLAQLGLKVVVEETFSFTPARSDLAALQVTTTPATAAAA